jgi:hypothetical protein
MMLCEPRHSTGGGGLRVRGCARNRDGGATVHDTLVSEGSTLVLGRHLRPSYGGHVMLTSDATPSKKPQFTSDDAPAAHR